MTTSEQAPNRGAVRPIGPPDDRELGEAVAGARRGRSRLRSGSVAPSHDFGWEQRHWMSRVLHRLGEFAARSSAGLLAAVLVVAWAILGLPFGYPGWWQTVLYAVTGSVTFVMVFVIQHTQERQTLATQRKLDELIRSSATADDSLIAVEEAGDEHLKALNDRNLADRAEVFGDAQTIAAD